MAKYTHLKQYMDFKGLDLRSSEVTTPSGFARTCDNADHTSEGALTVRQGSKIVASSSGSSSAWGYGQARLDTTDILGNRKTEMIVVGQTALYKLYRGSFTITNTTGSTVTASMYYDEATTQFRFKIISGVTTHVNVALGLGITAPTLLSAIETAVDAVTGLAMSTPTSAASIPGAFIDIVEDVTIANAATETFYYSYRTAIDSSGSSNYTQVKNHSVELGLDAFENASTCIINGVLYVSSGTNVSKTRGSTSTLTAASVTKYDGQRWYRAGMKKGIFRTLGAALVVAGNYTDAKGTRSRVGWTDVNFRYLITFKQIDKVGNVVENLSTTEDELTSEDGSSNELVRLSLAPNDGLDLEELGFNTARAKVNGNQSGVLTITVDNGTNTLVAGDIAYFWDENQDRFIQREVTAVTATTVTISTNSLDSNQFSPTYDTGGNIHINDDAIISANLRAAIWRADNGSSQFILQVEIPYAPESVNPYYYDDNSDSDYWHADYVQPAYVYMTGCPQGRYVASFNNQLIVAGNDKQATTFFFSDIISPELFPEGIFENDVQRRITGIKQTGDVLCVSEERDINIVSGDLGNLQFRVDKIGNNVGCTSHHSMQEIQEGVLCFLSKKGPYVLLNGRQLEPLGGLMYPDGTKASRLEPYFTRAYKPAEEQPVSKRSIAGVLLNQSKYVLFVPWELPSLPGFATSNSVAFVFDYQRGTWSKWTGVEMSGGIAEFDDTLYWTKRSYDGSGTGDFTNAEQFAYQMQPKTKGKYAYGDHNAAIAWDYRSHWEFLRDPGLFKRFLRTRLACHETRPASTTAMQMRTYVDFDDSALSFDTTLSWTTEEVLKIKILSEVCRSMQWRFSASTIYQAPILTGYELEAVTNFRAEFKE